MAAPDARVFIVVSREDAGQQTASFRAWIQEEPLEHDTRFRNGKGWFVRSLSEGHAFQVTLASPAAGGNRVLRIGYRRLRIREPPVAVQLAFSRVGPNYGLRQWVRVYRQFSARWWPEGGPATRARIVDDRPPAPIFVTLVWRWPQVRSLADNQAQANKRLFVNLIPDVIGGFSLPPRRHNSYLAGGSWPILADRISFVMGAKIYRDEQPTEGFAVGQFVPVDTTEAQVQGEPRRHVDFLFGLAIELVRSR